MKCTSSLYAECAIGGIFTCAGEPNFSANDSTGSSGPSGGPNGGGSVRISPASSAVTATGRGADGGSVSEASPSLDQSEVDVGAT